MSRADFSDPDIAGKIDDIKKGNSINWLLLSYVPKSDTKLKVAESGNGGLAELSESLNDGKILFGFVACDVNNTKKFVYIAWCGEGVTGMKKGLFSNHSTDVANGPFKGYHVQIQARTEADVDEKIVNEKLKKATGASYDSGQKTQGSAAKLVPASVAQGRQQATQSNAKGRVADKGDYNKKDESADFWKQQNQTETEEKSAAKPVGRTEYNKTNERNQFWAQNQQEQQSAQKPQANINSGNSSNLKNRFENPPAQTPPAKTAPPPNRAPPQGNAPKPPGAPPSRPPQHQAPPPPEPEQSYEEPAYEEPASEEPAYEEPAYEEQPAEEYQEEAHQETYQEEQTYQEEAPQESYEEAASGAGSQARALYDFDAENETDLNFKEGDIINVLDKTDPSGWYKGELNGVEGYFPSNFVEDI